MKKFAAFMLLSVMFLSACSSASVYITPPGSEYGTKTAVSPLPSTEADPDPTKTTQSKTDVPAGNFTSAPTEVKPDTQTPELTDTPVAPKTTVDPTVAPTDDPTVDPTSTPTVVPEPTIVDNGVTEIKLDIYEVTLYVGKDHSPVVTVLPEKAENKDYYLESDTPAVAIVKEEKTISARGKGKCTVSVISKDNGDVRAKIDVTVLHTPEGEITYIEGILIANKTFALPSTYGPGVDPEAKEALNDMFAAAKKDGLKLFICSGYRTYAYQKSLYNRYVDRDGKEKADTYSARPGHSEHQTGLAFDLNKVDDSFDGTPEAIWIAQHAHEYGFIVRYPKGKQEITGYKYEPWHVRYIGVEKAKAVYESGLCLEEFLGITSVYEY